MNTRKRWFLWTLLAVLLVLLAVAVALLVSYIWPLLLIAAVGWLAVCAEATRYGPGRPWHRKRGRR